MTDTKEQLQDENNLLMAEQQITGWNARNNGDSITTLVSAMNLTPNEWKKLVNNGEVNYLSIGLIDQINSLLGLQFELNTKHWKIK